MLKLISSQHLPCFVLHARVKHDDGNSSCERYAPLERVAQHLNMTAAGEVIPRLVVYLRCQCDLINDLVRHGRGGQREVVVGWHGGYVVVLFGGVWQGPRQA